MEATMVRRNANDENEEDGVGGVISKVPQFITAIIAIGGLIATYFMTIGDFRMKDMELQQRMTYLEQKVEHIEQSVDVIKGKLDARFPVVDADRQNLKREIDDLREVLSQMKPYLQPKK